MLLSNGRWQEEEEEDDMWGPHVSDRGEASMKFTYSYTPVARSKLSSYVFCGTFMGSE
jgi:hypothetical protein